MLRYTRVDRLLLGLLILSVLVSACASTSSPPQVSRIESQFSEVQVGESVNFSVEASGTELGFEWSAARGTIESQDAIARYTAPDTPGEDTVQVRVTGKGGTVVKTLTFNVIAPPPPPSPLPSDTPASTPTDTSTPTPIDTPSPAPTRTPSPTPTRPLPTEPPSPTPTNAPVTPTRAPSPTRTPTPVTCQGDTTADLTAQLFPAYEAKNYPKALACSFELERRWSVEATQQQGEKQASDCRYTPDPNDRAAFDSFWQKYWALNDVATGLFMRAEIFRIQGKCQEAKAIYTRVMNEYPCAFAWDRSNGGFFWNVADGARNGLSKPCP